MAMASGARTHGQVPRPRRQRVVATFLLVSSVAACDNATSNSPRYPDVQGTYTLEVTFDVMIPNFASGGGSVTIGQADRSSPALTGSATVYTQVAGVEDQWDRLTQASFGEGGMVSFAVEGPATYVQGPLTNRWGFVGSFSDDVITGSHGLELNGSLYTGTFRASRTAH
jgi:hypothetical protein